jgi:hypothetical protein
MVGIENVVSSRAINLATPYPITGKLAILVHYSYCVKEPVPEQRKLWERIMVGIGRKGERFEAKLSLD